MSRYFVTYVRRSTHALACVSEEDGLEMGFVV